MSRRLRKTGHQFRPAVPRCAVRCRFCQFSASCAPFDLILLPLKPTIGTNRVLDSPWRFELVADAVQHCVEVAAGVRDHAVRDQLGFSNSGDLPTSSLRPQGMQIAGFGRER